MQNLIKARPGWLMGLIACAALAACGGGDGQDESSAQNEEATQATALATTAGSWGWVADENGSFTLNSQRTARYGINGKWVQKTLAAGNFSCVDSVFGRDPARRSTKRCEVYSSGGTTTPTPATASLAWDATSGVTGYRLYYGTGPHTYDQALGSGIAVGNATSYNVSGLKGATLYYFAVTSVDSNGNESPFSNEVSKKTP